MNEYKKMAIMDIIQSSNTIEKIEKFKAYKFLLGDCRIFLFDEEGSNFDDSVKNKKIGKFGIWGIGDYTKTWILDSKHLFERSLVRVGKTIDFDLNILTYLNKVMMGHKINLDENEFLNYLSHLKNTGFQIGMTTALMERVQTKIDLRILSEMITSFVKLDNISTINKDMGNIYLSEDDYMRIKQIYDMALAQEKNLEQFNIVCCCIMKAYLIKTYDNSEKNKKVDMFIKYCLDVLNCYLEKEIVILSLYIMDDNRTHKVFKKIKNNNDVIKNILNVAWDIYHIRLVEQIMLRDNMKNTEQVILSFFGTADNGIIDAMQVNPVKAFVIENDYPISIHQMNINDICKNRELLDSGYLNASVRAEKIKNLDFKQIRERLETEILEKIM
ncbi:hypothetical protein [Holdemanella hominis]|uniref:Uncharacterized protein n=1 Tax=Holdemanella hominis TaxID=2764327 RepID=A0ABR7KFD9_9FIRM|nr:hypothetical protein [Holdemanella hominis]MBC6011430.1 hypothetical protein [Holdemanella hominis]